jgi:hypothetical protein
MSAAANLFFLIMRIFLTIYCVDKAKQLNRNPIGWGFFAFFFPIIATIWIQFMSPKQLW